jgi:glyoxylase-like metal-dependent hydrolase (beta-lactamase superfamily II)
MKVTTHGDYLIQVTRWPLLFPVNVYLVREDDGFTLIDTGANGSGPGILAAATALGATIRRIVLTHAHSDHVGALDQLRGALPAAEVLMTDRSARLLRGERTLEIDGEHVTIPGRWPRRVTRPTRTIEPGDRVGSLQVVAAPGHAPDQVAFLDTRDHTLIAGDAFQTRGDVAVAGTIVPTFPFPSLFTWDKEAALDSARLLRSLEPSRLATGHGPVLEDPLAAMDRAIAVAQRKLAGGVPHGA